MTPPGEAPGATDGLTPCPLQREPVAENASAPPPPNALGRQEVIGRSASLGARALAAHARPGTRAAIREARIGERVTDLTVWPPVIRGH